MDPETFPQKEDQKLALQLLRDALDGSTPKSLPPDLAGDPEFQSILDTIQSLQAFALALGKGDLSQTLPLKGAFAGSLKSLQASLRHLTWQVQMIEKGDFTQRVDFMGEFSQAFNSMVTGLQRALQEQDAIEKRLSEMNQELQAEIEDRKRAEFEERQAREMAEKLRTAGEEINRSLDFEALLETILVQMERIIPYDGANIFLITGDKAVMRKHTGYERFGKHVPALMDHFVLNLEDVQMYQTILETHHPVVVSDTLADPRWLRMDVDMKQIRSWCGLPLMVQDQVYGVLGLDKLQPGFYTEKDIEFLQIYAGQAALALENARLFSELGQMARLDALTGVYNRRAFFERAQEELQRSCRYGSEVSVIMLDIDRFKRTNDTYGHPVGDQVLQTVARRCRESLREVDLFGRYGGEEFVALLPQTGREQAAVTAERLRQEIADTDILTDAGSIHTSISLGVTAFNRNCEILEELLERADQALYRSKRNGRNQVCVV